MDKIVEAILKLQPFGAAFKKLGLNDDWSALFSVILIVLLVTLFSKLYRFLIKRYKFRKEAIENIKPQFDHLSIKKAKKFYIQTQYQNASPARQEEPGFTHQYIARNKLIPFFIKTAFNERADSERFYLILADSGMGKTTFMINLYLRYNSFIPYFRFYDYDMKLFRFSNPDTINQVKLIPTDDARKTILLLDALDEDQGIISTNPNISDAEAFQKRINEIIEITKNFREVIITCRTQYFPGQEKDPYELSIKRPDERGFYTLNKLYISPFNEKEVKEYLNKKFGVIPFINRTKKKRALKIVSKSKNLVMRPMLLSYIDYLIEDEVTNDTTTNIYHTLVNKWLQREAEKRKGIADRTKFIQNLEKLSFKTALAIYSNWIKGGRMHLSKEETLKIAREFEIELKPEEITGQSLLTCDGVGNWKFAHKSILEFFLANEAYKKPALLKTHFRGMDMAVKFYEELNPRLTYINKPPIKDEIFEFYIYKSPIHQEEDTLLANRNINTFEPWNTFYVSLKTAIAICNHFNEKHDYPPVYDEEGNLLDPNGNLASHLTAVHGFRLPTRSELQRYYSTSLRMKHYSSIESIQEAINNKSIMKFINQLAGVDAKNDDPKARVEWYHDGTTISVIETPKSTNSKSFLDASRTIDIGFEMPKIGIIGDFKFRFRMVFIP